MTSGNPYFSHYAGRHISVLDVLRWFEWGHLPDKQANICRSFAMLADRLVGDTPDSAELTVALRKLLEAKDAAVRASLLLP